MTGVQTCTLPIYLLIVSGEYPSVCGVDYLEKVLGVCRPYFHNLTLEVMPMKSALYERLSHAGLNGVVCFQETYHRQAYKKYHPQGMKSIYEWRLNGFDRMGEAGVHKIGMGVLIGLEDWRGDLVLMARHLRYLQKKYWRTRYSVNFPRMCPSESGYQPKVVMSDRELARVTFAFRIFDHDIDISYSTREKPEFRNNMMTLGVTSECHHVKELFVPLCGIFYNSRVGSSHVVFRCGAVACCKLNSVFRGTGF